MNYRVFDEDNPIYPKIHKLMSEFNFKFRKEKSTPEYEMMVDTGFMDLNYNVYLYTKFDIIVQSNISIEEITHTFENYTLPDMVVSDYLFTVHRINSVLIKYRSEGED
jgi:hypothetical protein